MEEKAKIIQATLEEFGVQCQVTHFEPGPTVTSYEITPAPGVRVESISGLERNLAIALQSSVCIRKMILHKSAVGIEVPNTNRSLVHLRELADNSEFHNPERALPLALGKDVCRQIVLGDLAEMPHLLITGAGGMGKTVCINSLLLGLLLTRTPDQVQLILIDLKKFEFPLYEFIGHLAMPIIEKAKEAELGLSWAIGEMERRYELFKMAKVRDIKSYNALVDNADEKSETKLPYIVIVIDELAELMSSARQEIEPRIVRLAQLSRVTGIHMVLATQRPSENVFTDIIKVNVPARIAFRTAAGSDSRAIINAIGAENLPDKGALLYLPPGQNAPVFLQGMWVSDEEIRRVTSWLCSQRTEETIA
jgi:S-DNA-T family DNA segregation ATPase FtsK/SpoIIIE